MQMRLQHIPIHPALQGYIEKIWVFESSGRVPDADMKLIVPNGLIKLVIPFRNGISGRMEGWYHLSKEHQLTLIGICDRPSVVDAEADVASGTIGVEFSPMGAYRFFRLRQSEIKNQIHPLDTILGNTAKRLQEHIANTADINGKIKRLQQFLLRCFMKSNNDAIFEYCISRIRAARGGIPVKQLEKETGYTSRWLHMKFEEKAGLSPKHLSAIVRFQYYYQALAQQTRLVLAQKDFYDLYYDQAHFIREFKRFTGLPPARFEQAINDFGKIFYKK